MLLLAGSLMPALLHAARSLPQHAQYGKLTKFSYPHVTIGGKTLRMSPGAKIYDEQNRIIMPAAMRQSAPILYQVDNAGELSSIWILNQEEARAHAPKVLFNKPSSAPASPAR